MSTTPYGTATGTIEFACKQCGRSLKVAAANAGKQARCPQCGGVTAVPNQSQPAGQSAPAAVSIDGYGASVPPGPLASAPFSTTPASTLPPANNAPPATAPAMSFGSPAPQPAPVFAQSSYSPPPQTTTPGHSFGPTPGPQPSAAASQAASILGTPSPAAPGSTYASYVPAAQPSPQTHAGRDTPTRQLFQRITAEISKVYVGQDELVLGTLVALFSSGHVLIESVPGLGKTLFVRTMGRVLGCKFGRIQFTADLMPSDITGAPIFDMKQQEFRFRPGPVFTQFLLADEINRSPAKTHAALLEIMQEYRVTVDGKSHTLDRPFLVLATQNPIESEGTYNLPEAQLDRFMFKLVADYPRETEEAQILKLHSRQIDLTKHLEEDLQTITSPEEILSVTRENGEVRIDEKLVDYINKIVRLTRQWPQFHMGASPRAGIALMQAARSLAAFSGRDYAVPDDVVQVALPALRHRVILNAEAEVEGQKVDELLTTLIRTVEVPRL